jgi:excinuclease ABC subunit A
VALLLKALHGLVAAGNSVIVIEHDADTITQSDWVIELGPGPGVAGGEIIYSGAPAKLIEKKTPWGAALRERVELHAGMRRGTNILTAPLAITPCEI